MLSLPYDYLPSASPLLQGTWFPSVCQLVVTSIMQTQATYATTASVVQSAVSSKLAATVALSDMARALAAVVYRNADPHNPLSRVPLAADGSTAWKAKRQIAIAVDDSGSDGLFADGATGTLATPRLLTIAAYDHPPVIAYQRLYDTGDASGRGWLSSPDAYARVIAFTIGSSVYRPRRFPFLMPVVGTGVASNTPHAPSPWPSTCASIRTGSSARAACSAAWTPRMRRPTQRSHLCRRTD